MREDRNPTRDERWALHKRAFCHRVPQARVRESILCLRCRKVDAIHTLIGRSPAPNLLKVFRVKKEMFYGPLAAGAKLSRVFNLVLLSTWPYLVGRGESRLLRSASVRFEVFLSVVRYTGLNSNFRPSGSEGGSPDSTMVTFRRDHSLELPKSGYQEASRSAVVRGGTSCPHAAAKATRPSETYPKATRKPFR